MASNGSFTGSTNQSGIVPTIVWSAVQSEDGNYSDVTAVLQYRRTDGGNAAEGSWTGSLTINGTVTSGARRLRITAGTDAEALTASVRVMHDPDGTKTVTISALGGMADGPLHTTSISDDVTLSPIPRASSVSCGDAVLGEPWPITIDRLSPDFTHTVTCAVGAVTAEICTKTAETSLSWTPPRNLALQILSQTYAEAALTVITYAGDTEVGRRTVPVTVYVPGDMVPAVSVTLSVVNDDPTADGWGAALKGYSRLRYAVTASGAFGADITDCQVSLAGQTFTALSGTTGPVKSTGPVYASVTVTDTRGRTATVRSRPVTVHSYAPPVLTETAVYRAAANGTANDTGTYLRCLCRADCTNVGTNDVTCRVRYRPIGGSWSAYTVLLPGVAAVTGGSLNPQTTYEAELSAVDALGSVTAVSIILPSTAVSFHLREGGGGAAFGQYSSRENALECAWDAYFDGDVFIGGQSVLPARLTGAFTADTTNVSGHDVTLRYIPALRMVTARIFIKVGDTALSAHTAYDIGTVAREYCPSAQHALSFYCLRGGNAILRSTGNIQIVLDNAVSAGSNYSTYINGFWFI